MNDFREYANYCDEIYHHGVKGQSWGKRRYQNPDGSLTEEGRRHYGYMEARDGDSSVTKRVKEDWAKLDDNQFKNKYRVDKKTYAKRVEKYGDPYKHVQNSGAYKMLQSKPGKALQNVGKWTAKNHKTIAKVGVGLAVAGLTAAALSNPATRQAVSSAGKQFTSKIFNGGMEFTKDIPGWNTMKYAHNYADAGKQAAAVLAKKRYLLAMAA